MTIAHAIQPLPYPTAIWLRIFRSQEKMRASFARYTCSTFTRCDWKQSWKNSDFLMMCVAMAVRDVKSECTQSDFLTFVGTEGSATSTFFKIRIILNHISDLSGCCLVRISVFSLIRSLIHQYSFLSVLWLVRINLSQVSDLSEFLDVSILLSQEVSLLINK